VQLQRDVVLAVGALLGIDRVTPGAIALLLGATGLGNVVYFVLDRRLK